MSDGASKFPPSLNLNDVRRKVGSLREGPLDLLACILDGDKVLCEVGHIDPHYLERVLTDRLYKPLGISCSLSSAEKRRAAGLMNKIFDQNGWRPEPAEEKFLLVALGLSEAPAEPLPDAAAVQTNVVETPASEPAPSPTPEPTPPSESLTPLPSVEAVAARMKELSAWKLNYVHLLASGKSFEEIRKDLSASQAGIDLSSVERGVHQVLKALDIRQPFQNEGVLELIKAAHAQMTQEAASEPPLDSTAAVNPASTAEALGATTQEATAKARSSFDLEAYVERVGKLAAEGKLTSFRVKVLDAMLECESNKEIAERARSTEGAVAQMTRELRMLFAVPMSSAANAKARGKEEREMVIAIWKLYCERNPSVEGTEGVLEETAPQEPTPPETQAAAPIAEVSPPEAPEVLEAPSEPQAEPQAPEPRVPQSERLLSRSVTAVSTVPGLLQNPQSIKSVKILFSSSPQFAEEQAEAIAEGYRPEQVESMVLFQPEIVGVGVLTLVKR